jgi:ubiquinone biosynthesis monooxygenase Coq7
MTEAARPIPPRPGLGAGEARLGEILRVDHAGELAAVHIYRGQRAVLGQIPAQSEMSEQLADMESQEAVHLRAFDQLLTERGVRPSLLTPLWRAAGFALGAGTALLGEKAVHACTEAVETVIEAHYASQIAELSTTEPQLADRLSGFRDEEIAHRDLAVEEGAHQAAGYAVLGAVIRAGCRAAIKISEKL